jgi:hypothetical protein
MKPVAGLFYGLYRVNLIRTVYGLPQSSNVNINRPFGNTYVVPPDCIKDFAAAENALGRLHKKRKEAELCRSKMNRPTVALDAMSSHVHG